MYNQPSLGLSVQGGMRDRVKTLMRPKELGGIGLPDIRAYQQAVHTNRIIDWCRHAKMKQWVKMEFHWAAEELQALIWDDNRISQQIKTHPTIAIKVSRALFAKSVLGCLPSRLLPVSGNPMFQPGKETVLASTSEPT